MKRNKQLIVGIIIGSLLTSIITLANSTFIAEVANFPVIVNGVEVTLDMPIVTIEGRTYLPLRSLGNVLGITVNWNDEKRQAEILTSGDDSMNVKTTALPEWASKYSSQLYYDENGKVYLTYLTYEMSGVLKKTGIEADPIEGKYDEQGNQKYNMVLYNKGGNRWHDKDYVEQDWIPIKENIPYIFVDDYSRIELEYFEKEILPLDESLR